MKSNIASHLRTLFPQLKHVENFEKIEVLGQPNIAAMMDMLKSKAGAIAKQIEANEEKLKVLASTKEKEGLDVMEVEALCTEIAFQKIKFGNNKRVTSNLQFIMGDLRMCNTTPNHPVIPCLRNENYFSPGDDIMIYIGDERFRQYETFEKFKQNRVPKYNWVCGKVIDKLAFFSINPIWKEGQLGGHADYTGDYFVFKRKEFFKIRTLLQSDDISHGDYSYIFRRNFNAHQNYYNGKIDKILLDPSVEDISNEMLLQKEKETILFIIETIVAYGNFSAFLNACEMAEQRNIKIPDLPKYKM